MNQNDKQLLLIVLCSLLPYKVKVQYKGNVYDLTEMHKDGRTTLGSYNSIYGQWFCSIELDTYPIPYLRTLSSMTDEELAELKELCTIYNPTDSPNIGFEDYGVMVLTHHLNNDSYTFKLNMNVIDWLYKKRFDCNGLIPKGLAIEAPEGMYN